MLNDILYLHIGRKKRSPESTGISVNGMYQYLTQI